MDRDQKLTALGIRPVQAVLPENRAAYTAIVEQAKARLSPEGQAQLVDGIEKAYAAGEPGLLDQARPNYITEEAVVRTFATSFGEVVLDGSVDQLPEFTLLEPDDVKVVTVAVTLGRGGPRRRRIYAVAESQTLGAWKEIQTEPVEVPFVNPFFQRKRAILDAQANDKMAYSMAKELDRLAFAAVTNALKTTFAPSDKVWTFKDADVKGLPTGNNKTSSVSFWKTLRTVVIPYFQGVRKADRVINVHILHTDLQYLYQVAPIGASLGGYSDFQREIYDGNVQEITIYGHRFRIIPENWLIDSGEMYCVAGPVYRMWLPPQGSVTHRITRDDGSSVLSLHRVYEILSPSTYWTNVLKTTWSTTDTSG
jgi:hypothetical protein